MFAIHRSAIPDIHSSSCSQGLFALLQAQMLCFNLACLYMSRCAIIQLRHLLQMAVQNYSQALAMIVYSHCLCASTGNPASTWCNALQVEAAL
jgi:hypothetical protein